MPTGVLVVGTEVTDKVHAKKELAEKKERLELAVQIANLGDFKLDLVNNTAAFSKQAMKWFGLDSMQETLSEVLAKIHPGDKGLVSDTLERAIDGHEDGRHDITYRLLDHQGILRHIRSIGKVQFENGIAVAMYGTLQDVSDQILVKEAIEQTVVERTEELQKAHALLFEANSYLQTIIDLFQEPLQVLEPVLENGNIVDFRFKLTNAAYAAYASTTPENLYGKNVSDFFPGYLHTSSFTNVAETQQTGKTHSWEIHYSEDGLDLYNVMSATKMDEDVIVHFTDVTKLKHLQLELEGKVTELKRSNDQLEEFSHAASHDLKEPIRKIQIFTSQLKETLQQNIAEHESRLLNRIEVAGRRMGLLVDDLLTYSHVSQSPHLKEDVDLADRVQRVLEDLELAIQEKGATVRVEQLPFVKGQGRQLQQLFQNLISNAIKYSKPDVPPHIRITSTQMDRGGIAYFRINVKDNGIGFEQEYHEHIFRMFKRLHAKSDYDGTGIGLAIVKKVVEYHDGFIETESKIGEGSVFKVYLPVL
jgi:signal transduction histidine kinase